MPKRSWVIPGQFGGRKRWLSQKVKGSVSSRISKLQFIILKLLYYTLSILKNNSDAMTHFLGKVPVTSLISCFSENIIQYEESKHLKIKSCNWKCREIISLVSYRREKYIEWFHHTESSIVGWHRTRTHFQSDLVPTTPMLRLIKIILLLLNRNDCNWPGVFMLRDNFCFQCICRCCNFSQLVWR